MNQCKGCGIDRTQGCILKFDTKIKKNIKKCPCSMCIVKAACDNLCYKRKDFYMKNFAGSYYSR